MSYESVFPPDTQDAEATYKNLLERGRELRAPHRASWSRTRMYLQGMRIFTMNFKSGSVKGSYVDERGRLKFVFEQLLSNYTTQLGRLLGMDFTPRVVPNVQSLDGLRSAAVAQAVLREMFPTKQLDRLKRDMLPPILCYGTVGLELADDEDDPKLSRIECLQPWDFTPIPVDLSKPSEARGLIILKNMAVERIRAKHAASGAKRGVLAAADKTEVARGDLPGSAEDPDAAWDAFVAGPGRSDSGPGGRGNGADRGKTDRMEVMKCGVVYLWDDRGYLEEQLVFVSGKLLRRDTFKGYRIYRPVTTIHDIDAGGFWSRAWMELQIPMNQETEGAIAAAFKNQQDMDLYGTTFMPASWGINAHALVAKGGRKFQLYDPDGMSPPNQSIFQFNPFNAGTMPIAVANLGVALGDRLANQPQAMTRGEAPGRVDSRSALGALMEASNIPLSPTAAGVASGLSDVYSAALCRALRNWQSTEVNAITLLDDSLAGIIYNPQSGMLDIGANGIPHPDKVHVTIQSMLPVSKEQLKLELNDQFFRLKTITASQYRIKARLLNLDLPVCNETEWQNYCKARVENLLLFHDGQTVPQGSEEQVGVLLSESADMHNIHVEVHRELVATIRFSLAAPPVRQRILAHLKRHEDALGILPAAMPSIEDAAQEEIMRQQLEERMTAPGPGALAM